MTVFIRMVAWARAIPLKVIFPFALIDSHTIELLRNKVLGIDSRSGHEEWYVKNLIKLGGNDVFLDVGASVGQWSIWACPEVKLVVALEPNKAAYRWLLRNTKRYKNIRRLNLAAWSISGNIDSWVELGLGSTSYTVRPHQSNRAQKRVPVSAIGLDNLVSSLNAPMENIVVKIDVEGAELQVLDGASELLKKARVVILEVHQPKLSQKIQSLQGIFQRLGYEIVIVRKENYDRNCHIIASRVGFKRDIVQTRRT